MTEEPDSTPIPSGAAICPVHQREAKWQCGVCGLPVCSYCRPAALHYHVFHPQCIAAARDRKKIQEQQQAALEAPSAGVRALAWTFLVTAILLFGTALLLLGFALFSQTIPLRSLVTGTAAGLETIPGGRTALHWLSAGSLAASALLLVLGVGLLNCASAARKTVLFLAWLEAVLAVLGWVVVAVTGTGFSDVPVLALFLIWFFSRRSVKRQFQQIL